MGFVIEKSQSASSINEELITGVQAQNYLQTISQQPENRIDVENNLKAQTDMLLPKKSAKPKLVMPSFSVSMAERPNDTSSERTFVHSVQNQTVVNPLDTN